MKNQNKTEIRLSVKDAWTILSRLHYERTTCVKELEHSRKFGYSGSIWEREIAETDALIATIKAQL